ncbi:unnamed protein product [Rotaria sp. Silwood1]|nr:unnamed protein product [Rotaria sp. Silwood1]CAF3456002.1 unnamed protein product [Rotaria sp. Silwood1]
MKSILLVYLLFITSVSGQSPCDEVSFVDRAGWGAREPTSITNLTGKPLSFYVIHHSYQPPNCYDDTSCIQRVKAIQDLHQLDRGWVDIGYHFLVGENGKVYEGRGWDRQGAHAPEWNNDAYGICIIGDFRTAPPNEKALSAVYSWIRCGIARGHVKKDYHIITHRQSQRPSYTECPGDGTFNVVNKWSRFCSFQNSGANLTANETRISLALDFCKKELKSNFCEKELNLSPSASIHLFMPILLLIYFF